MRITKKALALGAGGVLVLAALASPKNGQTPTPVPTREPTARPAVVATVPPTATPWLVATATTQPPTTQPTRPPAAPTAVPSPVWTGYTCDKCIKGNIADDGHKLYHFPGCQSYAATVINASQGERLFSSEAEAQAAGWKKAQNCP